MSKRNTLLLFALFVPSTIALTMYAYLGSFSRFISDDYCSYYLADRLGILRFVWYWYITFGGRFAAIATDWLITLVGPDGVHLVPPLLLLTWLGISALAVSQLILNKFSTRDIPIISLSLAALALSVGLLISPSVPQSLYWWNGMRTYSVPLVLLNFYIAQYYWSMRNLRSGYRLLIGCITSFFTLFLVGGFNETLTPVLFCALVLIIMTVLVTKIMRVSDPDFLLLACGFLGVSVALLILVTAPGGANRQTYFHHASGIMEMLSIAGKGYVDFWDHIIHSPQILSGLVGAVLAAAWLGMQSNYHPEIVKSKRISALVAFLSATALSFVAFIPSAYALADVAPGRAQIVGAFALTFGILLSAFEIGELLSGPKATFNKLVFLLTAALIWFSAGTNTLSLYSSRGSYIDYARTWDRINSQIIRAKENGDTSITIPRMNNWAGLEEPNDNPKYWVTLCFTKYYGIQVYGPNPDISP
jgi:hypothetical protein